jgi:hypothetical protein
MFEARKEVYQFIDALRHSYVSGKYVMEFGEVTADLMGRLFAFFPV